MRALFETLRSLWLNNNQIPAFAGKMMGAGKMRGAGKTRERGDDKGDD